MRSSAIRRFGSYFIDNILSSLIGVFFIGFIARETAEIINISYEVENGLITMAQFWTEYMRILGSMMLKLGLPQVVLGVIYMVVLPYYWNGKTIGRHIVGVHIKMQDGSELGFWTIFVREVIFKFLWWTLTLGLGSIVDFIMVAARKDKQTIRDIITRTEVVDLEGESVKKEYKDF
jgi:uncharacterized RDD family membrane protein YckC